MELPTRISSGIKHGDVFTTHYYGPVNLGTTLDVIPEDAPFTSIEIFKPSFGFRNKCTAQTWPELMAYSINLTDLGNYVVFATSGNRFAFHKDDIKGNGLAFNRDDVDIEEWIGATTGSYAVEYVKKPTGEMGLYESSEYTPNYERFGMTRVNVPIKGLHGKNVDINRVGEYVSRIANLEADLRDVIFRDYFFEGVGANPETEAWLEFLTQKGLGPAREIDAIGVEDLERAIARTYHNDKTAILAASKDIYQKALAIAEAYGLEGEEAVRFVKGAIWYHELYHVFDHRRFKTEGQREIDVGKFLAEFFGERAPMLEGKIAQYYRALARYNEDYAKGWKGRIKGSISLMSKVESLARGYASEAREMGLNDEEARDYVANRLNEYFADLEKENPEAEQEGSAEDSKYDKHARAEDDIEEPENETPDDAADAEEAESDDAGGESGED